VISTRLDICDSETDELEFRVYFQVYASRSSMRRGIRRLLVGYSVKAFQGSADWKTAAAYTVTVNPDTKKFPKDMVVFFSRRDVGHEFVAHELTHVLTGIQREGVRELASCKRWGKKMVEASEDIADTMQMLTREFWNWWEKVI